MARTALDLTPEELRSYRLGAERDVQQAAKRWEQAWEVARRAAHLLRQKFGASRVVVFGLLAHRAWFTLWSDIDLAAWGIPADQFYRAVAAVTGISPEFEVNLVDLEGCRPTVRQMMSSEGIDL